MNTIALTQQRRIPLRTSLAAAIAVGAVGLSGIAVSGSLGRPATQSTVMTGGIGATYLDAAPDSPLAGAAAVPLPEVHIANDGLVLLRGANVVSESGNSLVVDTSWSARTMQWNITTSASTRYYDDNGDIAQPDISPGQFITVTGMLQQSAGAPTIIAQFIRQ